MTLQRMLQTILSMMAVATFYLASSEFCDKRDTDHDSYIIQCSGINSNNTYVLNEVLHVAKIKHPQYDLMIHVFDSVGDDLPLDIFEGYNIKSMLLTNCNFTDIPYDLLSTLPTYVHKLDLSSNLISDVSFERFNQLPFAESLYGLYLQDNRIAHLPEDAFANFTSLEMISLEKNRLTSVLDNTFRGLTKLTGLYLHQNHIANVGTDAFVTLSNLRLLMLDINNIRLLNEGTFSVDKQSSLFEIPLEGLYEIIEKKLVPYF